MPQSTILLPFQPASMSTAQLAAVSYLARYSGHTHALVEAVLRRNRGAPARQEVRVYACAECNGWHLTSRPAREGGPDSMRP
jgi:hypothetical protein